MGTRVANPTNSLPGLHVIDIDHESALLIAQLQLDDAIELSAASKGKARADAPLSDQEAALRIQAAELASWKQSCHDAVLARSVQNAVDADAELIEAFRLVEETIAADRRAAELLSRGATQLPPPTEAQRRVGEDKAFLEVFKDDVPR